MSPKIQAPRGTFDVLGDDALARAALEAQARRILERAGYARIETPTFEATELFARGVGESTDVVQKEMYTLDEGPSESLTLRPEGTAPVCRAYLEHGMHKLPQPVKLWYLSSFFRRERPQAGRFRQFWQVGAEAIGSDDPAVDAELILLLAELLEAVGARGLRLRLSSLGTPATRETYRARAPGLPARARGRAVRGGARAHRPQPAARVRRRPPRHAAGDGGRAAAARPPRRDEDREHFDDRARAARRRRRQPTRSTRRSCAGSTTTRARCSSSTSDALGAQSGVGGGGRYDGLMEIIGGPPTPGMGWAAGRRADPAGLAARRRSRRRRWTSTSPTSGPSTRSARSGSPPTRAAPATRRDSSSAGRSLKGQLKQADRAGARYVAILGDEGTSLKDMESGEQKTVEPDTVMHHIRGGKAL